MLKMLTSDATTVLINSLFRLKPKSNTKYCSDAMAARGENGREGCEISSLVEHTGFSPWLFL